MKTLFLSLLVTISLLAGEAKADASPATYATASPDIVIVDIITPFAGGDVGYVKDGQLTIVPSKSIVDFIVIEDHILGFIVVEDDVMYYVIIEDHIML